MVHEMWLWLWIEWLTDNCIDLSSVYGVARDVNRRHVSQVSSVSSTCVAFTARVLRFQHVRCVSSTCVVFQMLHCPPRDSTRAPCLLNRLTKVTGCLFIMDCRTEEIIFLFLHSLYATHSCIYLYLGECKVERQYITPAVRRPQLHN